MKEVKNWVIAGAIAAAMVLGNSFCGWFSIIGDANAQYAAGTNYNEQGGTRTVVQGSLDVTTTGEIDFESGSDLLIAGSSIIAELAVLDGVTASTAELNLVDGLTSTTAELDAYTITVTMATLCTGSSVWVVAPHAGAIIGIWSVIDSGIGSGDTVLDAQIAAADITDGNITVTASGAAVGDVDTTVPTAANVVTAGQAIEIATDGNCDGTAIATISILIDR